eukprot:m.22159 g.22159  ORF g.22159 m.22159 type:complete len:459 (-) comp6701_c0_seq1:136-1512(-)
MSDALALVQHALCLGAAIGTTAIVAVVARFTLAPKPSVAGFYLGVLGSHLQIVLIALHAWVLRSTLDPGTAGIVSVPGVICGVAAVSWLGLLFDFADAHRVRSTLTVDRGNGQGPCKVAGSPAEPTALSLPPSPFWLRGYRLLLSVCPPLWLLVRRLTVQTHKDLVFLVHDNVVLKLDVCVPRAPSAKPLPIICFVHGGGWIRGSKNIVGTFFNYEMASRGWAVFTLDYRLSKFRKARQPNVDAKFPDHITDVKSGLAWIRQHAAEYGADPNFIVIAGNSAGGHLAALASLTPSHPQWHGHLGTDHLGVQGCISIYGVHDTADLDGQWKEWDKAHGRRHPDPTKTSIMIAFIGKYVIKEKHAENQQAFLDASPLHHARTNRLDDPPPFLLFHGTKDILVPMIESELLHQALQEHHDSTLVQVPGGHHGFDTAPGPRGYACVDLTVQWLDQLLSQRKAD